MPLRPIEFVGRGGNTLLNSLLSGATVSLNRALADGVQLTRDATSNQLVQERNALGEIRFDRTFREDQFRDRRNFDRRVFTEDRGFAENVRQFNITAEDRDQDRALRAELGRGNLGIARERLNLESERQDLFLRRGELGLEREQFLFDSDREKQSRLEENRRREAIFSNPETAREFIATDPDNPLTDEEVEAIRARELDAVAREYEFLEFPRSAARTLGDVADIGVLPPKTPRDRTAESILVDAQELVQRGDYAGAAREFARAEATALPDSPTFAAIQQERASAEAYRDAFAAGLSRSSEAADKVVEQYTNYRNTTFPNQSLREAIDEARNALSRQDYIDSGKPADGEETPSEKDTREKRRAQFYDSVRDASPRDIETSRSQGDPYATELDGLLGDD